MNDEELLAAARELYSAPVLPNWARLMDKMQRLRDHPFDQQVPEGISNPYWEIIREMPTDHDHFGDPMPRVHGSWLASGNWDELIKAGLLRNELVRRYSWSIPSPGDLTWIKEQLGGQGVVEVGAGTGYWAWQMSQYGIDVEAYDIHKPGEDNNFAKGGPYHPIRYKGVSKPLLEGKRALFLCWPSYAENWAYRHLVTYKGDTLIHVGEDAGGCTADDKFFATLHKEWDEKDYSPLHVTYYGIHCRLSIWKRK